MLLADGPSDVHSCRHSWRDWCIARHRINRVDNTIFNKYVMYAQLVAMRSNGELIVRIHYFVYIRYAVAKSEHDYD